MGPVTPLAELSRPMHAVWGLRTHGGLEGVLTIFCTWVGHATSEMIVDSCS